MAANPLALPIFAITLFVSAFLLFLVQPMIGKMILPSLGGTPQVWNTCQMFFQIALLCGYAYTHMVSTRLKLKAQLLVHGILLLIPLSILFLGSFNQNINFWFTSAPPSGGNPIYYTLFILLVVVGLPFFVVSTSAPLLQKWFTYTGHPAARDPYFLYGASNLGSMLSLVVYPFFIEKYLALSTQSWVWTAGYVALGALFVICVGLVLKAPPSVQLPVSEPKPEEKPAEVVEERKPEPVTAITSKKPAGPHSLSQRIKKGGKQFGKGGGGGRPLPEPAAPVKSVRKPYVEVRSDVMTPWRRLRWVGLAAVPSSLMLGIITYISTDVSAIPLFWVIPLALYLLSFILVFSRWPVVWTGQPHTLMVITFPIVFVCFVLLWLIGAVNPVYRSISFAILCFFMTAMVCHGELARDRPSPKHLTEFYLLMSVGGMLGGVFNGLLAPMFFWGLAELPIALLLACFLRPYTYKLAPVDKPAMIGFCAGLGLIIGLLLLLSWNGWLGVLLGIVVGAVVGAFTNFEQQETNGWSENLLISLFPNLGEWFDEKGKELRAEANRGEQPPEDESLAAKKKIAKVKVAPDYYVLNYTMDVALPILVLLVMIILQQYSGTLATWVQSIAGNVLGLSSQSAYYLRVQAAYFFPYGIPILCAIMFAFRPLRFGLTFAAIFALTFSSSFDEDRRMILAKDRSYFGILKVLRDPGKTYFEIMGIREYLEKRGEKVEESLDKLYDARAEELRVLNNKGNLVGLRDAYQCVGEKEVAPGEPAPYHYLMHGTTHHGLNYQTPIGLRRLATTYYHRFGPVGKVMERMNWFSVSERPMDSSIKWDDKKTPGSQPYAPQNTYAADVHMPVELVLSNMSPPGFSPFPMEQMLALWCEPPYACVGLGTGTMASYARPFQHMTFYEIDQKIRSFSLDSFTNERMTEGKGPYFNYLHDALERGAGIEVVMGDARLSMKESVEAYRQEQLDKGLVKPDDHYREFMAYQFREHYYFAIELDAFSSDAIPVHLITKEAIIQYFEKLTPQGILLVHTSNRHVDLVKPVTDIVAALQKEDPEKYGSMVYRVGNDAGEKDELGGGQIIVRSGQRGHFRSEYVIIASKKEYLPYPLLEPSTHAEITGYRNGKGPFQIWTVPPPPGNLVWTDDYTDLIAVFRWGLPWQRYVEE